jgi:cold shock protein
MGRGRDFRGPRKRGFDDDTFPSFDTRSSRPPARQFNAGGMSEAPASTGPVLDATVKWFNPEKGFGFIEVADGSGDAFLHIAVLQASGHEAVSPGAKLRVQVGRGAKGQQVTKVLEVDNTTASAQPPRSGFGGGTGSPRAPRAAPDPSTAVELAGTVKWFNGEKGFGFIAGEDGGKDVFVHISVLSSSGLQNLAEGQRVSMRVVATAKGREAISLTLAG